MSETARTTRQGRAYAADEVEALLRRALDVLMADGTPLRDVSVERLIGEAGISRSTFYKHFDDKSAMLHALSAGVLRRLYSAQRHWIAKGPGLSPHDVREGMGLLIDAYLEDEVVMRAVGEASLYDATIREAYLDGVRDYARALERFIRRGQKAGTIVADVPPAATADALAWMVERTVGQAVPGATPRRRGDLAEVLTRIVCVTLLHRDRSATA